MKITILFGFPTKSLNKVIATLEKNKINYLLLDRRNNYEVDNVFDNKKANQYSKIYENSKKYINTKRRIMKIYNELNDNIYNSETKNKIFEIEKILGIGVL